MAGRFFTTRATREAQEYWTGQPIPSPGDLPDPGIEPGSPALEADALTSEPPGKPRLFKYDLNQIPYDYTVEVRNRFKGLDPIECLSMDRGL